jgi:hypothetical protein
MNDNSSRRLKEKIDFERFMESQEITPEDINELLTYVSSNSDDKVDVSVIASCFQYGFGVDGKRNC